MNQSLRRTHFRLWLFLAPVTIAVLIIALAARPANSAPQTTPPHQAPQEQPK